MRSVADQFLEVGGRKPQIVRDTAKVGRIELVHLAQFSPMLQPLAESIRQPLDHGRGLIFNGHWKSSGSRKRFAMIAALGGKIVAPDQSSGGLGLERPIWRTVPVRSTRQGLCRWQI